jgi:hypothetical protein
MCLQTLFLRIPSVRARLNLPPLPKVAAGRKPPSIRDTWQFLKETMKRKQNEAIAGAEEAARKRRMMGR